MADVMIKCPQTGEAVPTSIGMDFETFKHATVSKNAFSCPACGQRHTWEKQDAFPDS